MTKHRLAFITAALAFCSIGLTAQQPQTQAPAKTQTPAPVSTGVNVTGTWTGSFKKMADGQPQGEDSAMLVLKQDAGVLTGTAGPTEAQQNALSRGKVETTKDGTSVAFDIVAPNGATLHFQLKLVEGHLKGDVTAEFNGQKLNALVDLTKAK
jgi:hypothetical protein